MSLKDMKKKRLLWIGGGVGTLVAGLGIWVLWQVLAFDRSMDRVYDLPLPPLSRSDDPAVIARGRHLAESLGDCTTCHGPSMAGGRQDPMGPLGTIVTPNATPGGRLADYSDAELARLIRHGVKRDGRSVVMMPSQHCAWWPDEDVVALISWLRTLPAVAGDPGIVEIGMMGKVLDRIDSIPFDIARRIDHDHRADPPPPAPTAAYGVFVATSCRGCHGETLAGGPIPGGPPGLPVPTNLTQHPTGLAGWGYDEFVAAIEAGRGKDGRELDPFMPIDSLRKYDDVELRALWAYLESVPPTPFGERG